jgi:Zn-dependent peptidase ImmA (M78 family)
MSFDNFSIYQEQNNSPRKPEKLSSDFSTSTSFQKLMMRRTTMPLEYSLQSVLMAQLELSQKQRVRFSLPGDLGHSLLEKVVRNTDQTSAPPPAKRRRFERRNSQTAAMLLCIQQDFNNSMNSIPSLEDSCASLDAWDSVTDSGIEMAEQLVREIKKQQEEEERKR